MRVSDQAQTEQKHLSNFCFCLLLALPNRILISRKTLEALNSFVANFKKAIHKAFEICLSRSMAKMTNKTTFNLIRYLCLVFD